MATTAHSCSSLTTFFGSFMLSTLYNRGIAKLFILFNIVSSVCSSRGTIYFTSVERMMLFHVLLRKQNLLSVVFLTLKSKLMAQLVRALSSDLCLALSSSKVFGSKFKPAQITNFYEYLLTFHLVLYQFGPLFCLLICIPHN